MAFLGSFLDPKTSILGTLGTHFGTFGVRFGGLVRPGDPKGDPLGLEVDFLWIFGVIGSLLGVTLGQFL